MSGMKRSNLLLFTFGLFLFSADFVLTQNAFGQSTISGTVYDKQRNQLFDIKVELQNDLYQNWIFIYNLEKAD